MVSSDWLLGINETADNTGDELPALAFALAIVAISLSILNRRVAVVRANASFAHKRFSMSAEPLGWPAAGASSCCAVAESKFAKRPSSAGFEPGEGAMRIQLAKLQFKMIMRGLTTRPTRFHLPAAAASRNPPAPPRPFVAAVSESSCSQKKLRTASSFYYASNT